MTVTEASTRIGNLLFDAFPLDVRKVFLEGGRFRKIDPGKEFVRLGDDVRSTFFATSGALSILAQPVTRRSWRLRRWAEKVRQTRSRRSAPSGPGTG